MFEKIKPYFYFTLSERRGIAFLSLLILLLLIIRFFFTENQTENILESISLEEIKFVDTDSGTPGAKLYDLSPDDQKEIEYHDIDLNTADMNQIMAIGIPRFAANNILKYREKGGVFRNNADLLKIYGIDSSVYLKVKNHIRIITDEKVVAYYPDSKKVTGIIEINTADTALFKELPGIGSVLSKRIVNYREILGGYVSIEQLQEVYGISNELFVRLKPFLIVDSSEIRRINLNLCDAYSLSKHPYINDYQANAIIKYRELMGDYNSVSELLHNHILTASEFEKIEFYLDPK